MKYRHTSYHLILAVMILLVSTPFANAEEGEGIGLGVKAGTLGLGVEVSTSLIDNTRLRGGVNYITYSFDSTISDINYDFETEFNSFSVVFDWHPFANSFFLSGGVYFNNNTISVEGSVDDDFFPSSFNRFVSVTDLASISGEVEFQPLAPYVGIGWRSNNGEQGWGVAFDLGVLFQGAPDVTNLQVNAPVDVNDVPEVRTFLNEQEEEIEDDLDPFQYYPVVSLMLTYNF